MYVYVCVLDSKPIGTWLLYEGRPTSFSVLEFLVPDCVRCTLAKHGVGFSSDNLDVTWRLSDGWLVYSTEYILFSRYLLNGMFGSIHKNSWAV